ncbi:MAG: peptide chain release factor 3 [Vulcanimicrobiota bacterium]
MSETKAAARTLAEEVQRRRTFAIISHPDAGKTTLTEKLLLYGGAVQMAGAVKARRKQTHVVSDWMEMEKERGISITSTVLSFDYQNYRINLLDTPGHQDFSEDTYRTLLAADAAVMVLDAARGIQEQTVKLFEVCKRRQIPILTFINKMDRPSLDPFELLEDIEKTLGLETFAANWPLGNGDRFRGVYDRESGQLHLFERQAHGGKKATAEVVDPKDAAVAALTDRQTHQEFIDGLELLEAGAALTREQFDRGLVTPVFFGSALSNFGVQLFLERFLELAPPPGARLTEEAGTVSPTDDKFRGFIFKIQADMNPRHRDRVAFLRICSGRFERGMKARCTRTGQEIKLNYAQQLFAQERVIVEEAYAGDVVGMTNSSNLILGDTLCEGEPVKFEPMPLFSPEHFARINIKDPSRRKHFLKAMDQLCLEGAIQVFFPKDSYTRDPIIGAVGVLQFEVVQDRLKNDYRVEIDYERLPYTHCRWLEGSEDDVEAFSGSRQTLVCTDLWEKSVCLFPGNWDLDYAKDKNPNLVFRSISQVN